MRARLTLSLAFACGTLAAQELPQRAGPGDFDPIPKLMLNDVPDVPVPGAPLPADESPAAPDIAKAEAALKRAQKNAAFRQRLYRDGVLSKVEAEQGQLQVIKLTRDLEAARLYAVRLEVEAKRKQPVATEEDKKSQADAEARLAAATTAANDAGAKWDEAQRSAAELRVQRERKLLALGAGTRSAVKRAEAALQKLAAPTGAP